MKCIHQIYIHSKLGRSMRFATKIFDQLRRSNIEVANYIAMTFPPRGIYTMVYTTVCTTYILYCMMTSPLYIYIYIYISQY